MNGYFVTGTDTAVGKTRVALALITALRAQGQRVAAFKPVASGCDITPTGPRNDDALCLQAAASITLAYEQVNPYAFAPAIAPHFAAREIGASISISRIVTACNTIADQCDSVVVEGAGGWLVPLNEHETMADLARALDLPVVLVVGLRLGCINHALLTARSIAEHGARCAGWVGNVVDPNYTHISETLLDLEQRLAPPKLGFIAWNSRGELRL